MGMRHPPDEQVVQRNPGIAGAFVESRAQPQQLAGPGAAAEVEMRDGLLALSQPAGDRPPDPAMRDLAVARRLRPGDRGRRRGLAPRPGRGRDLGRTGYRADGPLDVAAHDPAVRPGT